MNSRRLSEGLDAGIVNLQPIGYGFGLGGVWFAQLELRL